ncbi:MAG TPA: YciI family protein [bacterium]|nr:YciI family protein [bacterium]HMY35471.1 YciI family protein [bacterium]HNB10150.1 YciI family protein [bacterium]HNF85096.1 YciI family protein [bacterium]HNM14756.1 YciI family protein [bacterium]
MMRYVVLWVFMASVLCAQEEKKPADKNTGKKQFVYVLKLRPDLLKEENWKEADNAAVGRHFNYLKNLLAEGTLIFAGRTDVMNENTFGIAVFWATDESEAQKIMAGDAAVQAGVMTAQLLPFKVALMQNNNK